MHRSPRVGLACVLGLIAVLGSLPRETTAQEALDRFGVLALDRAAYRASAFALMPVDNSPGLVMVYGDRFGIVRVVRNTGRGVSELWRSRTLEGGPVVQVLVEDLDGRGGHDIIARTQEGRVYVFDELFTSRWESVNESFRSVTSVALANMDADDAYELVLFADRRLYYVDGAQFNREYESTQVYNGVATEILVGNVDTDFELEVVTSFGTVIDASSGEPEWQTEPFGQFIELLDIDGDGIQEIIGHTANQFLRVFDVDEQQEKPLQ